MKKLLLVLLMASALVMGCAEQATEIAGNASEDLVRIGELEETTRPQLEQGLAGLCSNKRECNEFCLNNLGRCREYCAGNPENPLCQKPFAFEQQQAQPTPVPSPVAVVRQPASTCVPRWVLFGETGTPQAHEQYIIMQIAGQRLSVHRNNFWDKI